MAAHQSFELTDKHCEILEPLTSKVRVLTHSQIARTFFARIKSKNKALHTLVTELEEAGFLKSYTSMVHPEIELKAPLCSYTPGDPDPDLGPVARETRGRWKRAPVATDIVYASRRAKHVFGGYLGGKKPRPSETRHDIHVAQVYLVPVDNTPFPTDFGNGAGRRAGEGVGLFGFLWWVGVVAPQRAYIALRLRVVFGFCVRSASAS